MHPAVTIPFPGKVCKTFTEKVDKMQVSLDGLIFHSVIPVAQNKATRREQ